MPETRSGKLTASEGVENAQEISLGDIIKEKLNELKDELLTEIKLLIKSEVDKALRPVSSMLTSTLRYNFRL